MREIGNAIAVGGGWTLIIGAVVANSGLEPLGGAGLLSLLALGVSLSQLAYRVNALKEKTDEA